MFGELAQRQQVPTASDLMAQIEPQIQPADRTAAQQLLKREEQARGANWQATVSLLQNNQEQENL